ncbi:MAG TPA: GxxExxY protein [Pirellulales bacterium]|jgi:hypothetical protein|nr:GxxExxY protein [Pirellulales bacterium]
MLQEGFQFMGAAFEVYNQLGYGMAEEVYQQSLEIELALRSIAFRTKHEVAMFYKARQLSTKYKPDWIVFVGLACSMAGGPDRRQLAGVAPATRGFESGRQRQAARRQEPTLLVALATRTA